MKDIVIIGAGGFAKKVACLIKDINKVEKQWNLLGFYDDSIIEKEVNKIPVLGNIDEYLKMSDEVYCVIAIGNGKVRENISQKLKNKKFAILIHPNVIVEEFVKIGEGSIICCNSAIAVNTNIGNHCIINFGSTIGHDVEGENFITICPGVHLSGNTKIGKSTMLGTGSCIIQGINIGENVTIGAGAVVIRDITDNCTAVGNPAKIIKIKN